jgi:hypothetical protein
MTFIYVIKAYQYRTTASILGPPAGATIAAGEHAKMRELLARLVFGVSFAVLPAALGCAGARPTEVDLPPQTLTEAPTSTAEQEAALVSSRHSADEDVDQELEDDGLPAQDETAAHAVDSEAAGDEAEPSGRKQTIVIQSGANADVTPLTLQQASASERERRAASNAPVAVITNQNLSDLAQGAQVTILKEPGASSEPAGGGGEPSDPSKSAAAGPAAAPSSSTAPASGSTPASATPNAAMAEEYWRAQALKIRLDWKAAVEEVDELQGEVADLRRRFYEEDDPHYRDNEIKPSWDRAIDRLQEAKTEAETQERKLTRFLEEGRKSGALPGWLREGIEFEPPATSDHSPAARRRTDDPWEPKVLQEEPRDP